jgi:hypothetical protein
MAEDPPISAKWRPARKIRQEQERADDHDLAEFDPSIVDTPETSSPITAGASCPSGCANRPVRYDQRVANLG